MNRAEAIQKAVKKRKPGSKSKPFGGEPKISSKVAASVIHGATKLNKDKYANR